MLILLPYFLFLYLLQCDVQFPQLHSPFELFFRFLTNIKAAINTMIIAINISK